MSAWLVPDQPSIEHVRTVQDDILPPDGTNVFQKRQIHARCLRFACEQDAVAQPGLPVDEAGQAERQAGARGALAPLDREP